uniref:Uncharacterized protein n=1 Tax=Rhizophora mucronata TaxID=61149 RepID=A0A2P2PFF1_RHIMU
MCSICYVIMTIKRHVYDGLNKNVRCHVCMACVTMVVKIFHKPKS